METGFINQFRAADSTQNLILVCDGSHAGQFVGFRKQDCCPPLAAALTGDLDGPSSCPPPDGTTILQFNVVFRDNAILAVDICFV